MKLLITGAGGAAAISVWKSLHAAHEIHMADRDPAAAGLYLVPTEQRLLLPSGEDKHFIPYLLQECKNRGIELLIPTVDFELLPIAENKAQFIAAGIQVPISSLQALRFCRDKYQLLSQCQGKAFISAFCLLTEDSLSSPIAFPCFAKPRLGAGSRGIALIKNQQDLALLPKDGSYLLQEFLPGEEYSVDVYIHSSKCARAAVPRLRLKIDSGIAVAAQTRISPQLSNMALEVAQCIDLRYVANIQFKADAQGQFKLLEINPRFPGTLPLTAAAGVDIPQLLIEDVLGLPFAEGLLPFKELMVVRYWTEHFFSIDEWEHLCQSKPCG